MDEYSTAQCMEASAMQMSYTTTRSMRRLAAKGTPHILSPAAKARLSWLQWHKAHGENKALTCRHFAISRPTLNLWLSRYDSMRPQTLENHSSKPARVRRPEWTGDSVVAVRQLREEFPRWGKKKLVYLLRRLGHALSESTVGRILRHLKKTGQLKEAFFKVKQRSRALRRAWARRKPKDFRALKPGDLVQVDTVFLRPLPNVELKQLSLIDVCSRFAAVEIASNASAKRTTKSLLAMLQRLPFEVKAIQVDGGSEFMSEFEEFCQENGRQLFVLPPHSPKLNGRVERLNRTTREELHECTSVDATVFALGAAALDWERIYNTVRPHEALGFLTPAQFLDQTNRYQGETL